MCRDLFSQGSVLQSVPAFVISKLEKRNRYLGIPCQQINGRGMGGDAMRKILS